LQWLIGLEDQELSWDNRVGLVEEEMQELAQRKETECEGLFKLGVRNILESAYPIWIIS
jgi:hypothetical protein